MNEVPPEPSPILTIGAFVLIAAAIIGGIILLLATRPQPVQITVNPPIPTSTPEPTLTPSPITVYVTGAVEQPETLVTLPYNSRVEDAIEAAGGAADNANLEAVNLAGIVRDGDQVHVPSLAAETEAQSVIATPSGGGIVFINSATLEELMTLPGIGETTAQAMIDYREANGAFTSLEDLDNVEGIGPATLEALEGLISFE